MSMTLEEKVEVWQAQQWFRIHIIEDDVVIQEAFVKELPKWNGISGEVNYSYFRVDWHSTTQTGLNNVTRWGEVQIYQVYDVAGSDLESGSVFASHSTWTVDDHTYQSFDRPCQLEVTPVYLIPAYFHWYGPIVKIQYNGAKYEASGGASMSVIVATEDMDIGEVVKVGADDQLLGVPEAISEHHVGGASVSVEGWQITYNARLTRTVHGEEQVYYKDRVDKLVTSSATFPYFDIPLDVNQSRQRYIDHYDGDTPVYETYKTPLVFEPIVSRGKRIRFNTEGFDAAIPARPDIGWAETGNVVLQDEKLPVEITDINRFLGWNFNGDIISTLTTLDWTAPDFSIIWPMMELDDSLVAQYSDNYFMVIPTGGDTSTLVKLTTSKTTLTSWCDPEAPWLQTAVYDDEKCRIVAIPGDKHRFKGFYFNSAVVGTLLSEELEVEYLYNSSDFSGEYRHIYAVFEPCPHVKLIIDDASWGEADIVDVEGASVLDDEGEGDLSFGRTYRFKAAIKDYGQFLGWYKPGPSYQSDPTDIVPFDDDYQNLEHLFVPQEAGDFTLIAKFEEPKRYNVVTAVTHDPSVSGGCTVSVAEGNHPAGAEAGVYFHGPLTVRGDANVGWRLVAWKINNVEVAVATEEEPCNEFLSFVLGDEGTIDENDTCTVEGVFEADKFDVDLDTDEHSANKGTVALKVSSDYGATYTTTTQRTDILAGSYLRVSVKASTGSAFRRIEVDGARIVAMPDTGDSGTYNYDFRLFKDVKVRAFFGATVTVAAKKKSSGTISDETNGRVAASLSKTGPWDSVTCDFTYGEKVWIKAINSEAEGATAYFNSWHSSSDSTLTAPLPKYGPLIDVTETGNATYWAKFSPQKLKVGIRITNDGDPQYGDIRVLTGGNDTYLVEVSQATYLAVIADYFDETSTANIQPYSPAGFGIDRYYVTNQGDTVRLVCEASNAEQYPFDHFGRVHYTAKSTLTTPEEEIEADELPRFVVYANVEIAARYQTSKPNNVIVRYATGSGRAMGGFDLAPVGVNGKMKTDALVTADYRQGNTVEVSATVKNGYKFVGWYSDAAHNTLLSDEVIYQFTMGDSEVVIFAAFAESGNRVFVWEGSTENKTMTWRSRRAVLPQAMNMVVAAVHADGYPLDLKVHHASSPDPAVNGWHDAEIEVKGQDARRLPIARAGKYVEVEVVSAHAVTRVAVGSSMQGLLG